MAAEELEGEYEPFNEKMRRLPGQLSVEFEKAAGLEEQIRNNVTTLGYGA